MTFADTIGVRQLSDSRSNRLYNPTDVEAETRVRMMNTDEAAAILTALANEIRLNIFRTLIASEGMAAGDLGADLGMAPSSLSFHLKDLRFAGLIDRHREGRRIIYRANIDALNGLLGFLVDDCCGGRPDLCIRIAPPTSGAGTKKTPPGAKK
ncbi:ArsR/SmtB family transcription factor [Varunaivibrio sulfuroxidans]|uniref:DNA-binding transcriptional ArsR family regulator n=1 Tax=Varunaivibrio sulfuroxidans TaxID=1773489 RepID=A0A4R3JGE0_9PROT|nr:metalloregulator ArsR/SmtB family transcription factor [Varunaivibrio sulfuroxidans]TCS64947.1 DNA-binding transcriptional ArsR family regulator [Varunaivibrio sulfuroxidans]WES29761.1 metalloregulator ArsR/SmtB family transcription factor [Varunaivibrio sulfuroxidans]